MLENPEVINSAEIITVKRQLMFAIQIAYGMVRDFIFPRSDNYQLFSGISLHARIHPQRFSC